MSREGVTAESVQADLSKRTVNGQAIMVGKPPPRRKKPSESRQIVAQLPKRISEALVVDGVRTPVYLVTQWERLGTMWLLMLIATAGVIAGTLLGLRVLRNIPEAIFRKVVSIIILALGVLMLVQPQ